MRIAGIFPIFAYFNAKTNPETKTPVLGHEKTETKFKIPQPPNTTEDLDKNQSMKKLFSSCYLGLK